MKLEKNGTFIYIDDSSSEAVSILAGYTWTLDDSGAIVIGSQTDPDFTTILTALDGGTATNAQIQSLLAYLTRQLPFISNR